MNELTHLFEGQELVVIENNNEPIFKLSDVCRILDIGHVATVKRRLGDDVVSNHPIQDRLGRMQQTVFINEDGLYDVILDSRKPNAKRFRKWITSDVLPSVRKHGGYLTPDKLEEVLTNPDTLILLATNLKEEQQKRAQLEQQIKREQPYTQFGKAVSLSDGAINIGAFAKMIYEQHGLNIGRNKLLEWMRENQLLIKSGREKNLPMQRFVQQGIFRVSTTIVKTPTGDVQRGTTLITGKGQLYVLKRLMEDEEMAERVN